MIKSGDSQPASFGWVEASLQPTIPNKKPQSTSQAKGLFIAHPSSV